MRWATMPDWIEWFLFCAVIIGLFWVPKVYYVVRSSKWPSVVGIMTNIRTVGGGDADVLVLTVTYEYDQISYVSDVRDPGSLDLRDISQIGRRVILLVDPTDPKRCVVRNNGDGLFNATATIVARTISRLSSSRT